MADGKICHPDDNFVSWKDFFLIFMGSRGTSSCPGQVRLSARGTEPGGTDPLPIPLLRQDCGSPLPLQRILKGPGATFMPGAGATFSQGH